MLAAPRGRAASMDNLAVAVPANFQPSIRGEETAESFEVAAMYEKILDRLREINRPVDEWGGSGSRET